VSSSTVHLRSTHLSRLCSSGFKSLGLSKKSSLTSTRIPPHLVPTPTSYSSTGSYDLCVLPNPLIFPLEAGTDLFLLPSTPSSDPCQRSRVAEIGRVRPPAQPPTERRLDASFLRHLVAAQAFDASSQLLPSLRAIETASSRSESSYSSDRRWRLSPLDCAVPVRPPPSPSSRLARLTFLLFTPSASPVPPPSSASTYSSADLPPPFSTKNVVRSSTLSQPFARSPPSRPSRLEVLGLSTTSSLRRAGYLAFRR
jgi:hypothetical protein